MRPEAVFGAFPRVNREWLGAAFDVAPEHGIDTPHEMASFLAQCMQESREFTRLEENLNYSAGRMVQVWPSRFPTLQSALPYAYNPMALANRVYGGRLGNGNEASGDGWFYRGRGPIQLTGKSNHVACQADTGLPLMDWPEILTVPRAGMKSACWYWKAKDLDRFDDDECARAETRLVNGGTHGLAERQAYMDRLLKALQ